MSHLKTTPTTPLILRENMAAEHFMVCPLCNGLNLKENEECFVCGWHGDFDFNSALVEMRLFEMIRACPELLETIQKIPVKSSPIRQMFQRFWLRCFGRLDFHV